MSHVMKHGTCYLLLLILAGSGCAQSRWMSRAASDAAPVRRSPVPGTAEASSSEISRKKTSSSSTDVDVSGSDSAGFPNAESQVQARWKPTAGISQDSFQSPPSESDIQQVAWQSPPADNSGDRQPGLAPTDRDAQPAATLELLEQLALSSNPTLLEFQARVDAANGRWLQVGLKPNPVASISAQEIGNEDSAGQYGALVGQEFVTANKLELNRNAAAWRVKQAEQELQAQQLRVLNDVRRGFYAVRVAQERVNVAGELHDIAQESVAKSRELIKFQEPATVLTQAEIEAELAAVIVDNATIQKQASWRRLAAAIGQPDLPMQTVHGELSADAPDVAWNETLDRLHRESPEIAAVAAEVERSRWALQRACAQATPNVTLQAGVFYDDGSSDPFATLQMSMPLPVNDWNQGGIAEAEANVMAAEQSVQRVELSLQQRLASVYQQYQQSKKQAQRYETTILEKASENLDLNRKSYNSGQSSYLAVLTAQRSYFQAKLAWLNALDQLWSATLQMEGLLLTDSLQSTTSSGR